MKNSINEAIASNSAHDLAEALASAGVTAARSGALHSSSEACEIAGYGTVFATSSGSGWQVRNLDGRDYPISQTELADELAEIVTMTQQL